MLGKMNKKIDYGPMWRDLKNALHSASTIEGIYEGDPQDLDVFVGILKLMGDFESEDKYSIISPEAS